MKKFKSVSAYLQSFPEWEDILQLLQSIILENPDVTETLKWSIPVYTVNGKNVLGLGAFKTHTAIWFFQGALLKDKDNVLVNAQEGKTQAMRHWKFFKDDTVPIDLVKKYIEEAVQNQKDGKTVVIKKSKTVTLPEELLTAFKANNDLHEAFEKLSNYKQKEYIEYISTAKRSATKESRLQKIIPMIIAGKGLNDKYR
ncbi:YdeI/OmpD-associated family protein [Kordia sp.]|uniref:YdeI/OmpD-associated family protein n=1 Tax=Kordia sp. TaxID=1965332 RepID=UPI003B5A7840